MSSQVLPNVERIAMFIGDESLLTPFVGSLFTALRSLGADWRYSDVLAMSGAGNRLRWMAGTWDPSNVDILHCEEPPFAPHLRALHAVGFTGETKLVKELSGMKGPFVDESTARGDIVASIDRGLPVIALGVIGPPECCVVFGYEDSGARVVGWNYFQGDEGFDPDKPFVRDDWFAHLWGYILLGERVEVPSLRQSGRAALEAVVRHARQDSMRGAKVGLSAWEPMLGQLEHDDFSGLELEFPKGSPIDDASWRNTVRGRFCVYCDALCQIHERGIAVPYWEKLAEQAPEWRTELSAAIDAWKQCATYGGFLWKHMRMSDMDKFRTPELRKILADEGRRCMQKDSEAIAHVERLLESRAG